MDKTINEQTTPSVSPVELLRLVRERLGAVYGERLKGVVLYGSRASGDAKEDGDHDFLSEVEGSVKHGRENSGYDKRR